MADYTVQFNWDSEAAVWYTTSDDVPGLLLESGSLDALIERVKNALPDLLELDGDESKTSLSIHFVSIRHEVIAV